MGRFYMVRGKMSGAVMTALFALSAALCLDSLTLPLAVVPLYFMAPVFLPFVFTHAGILPGAFCLALSLAGWGLTLGAGGVLYGLIFYGPLLIAFFILTRLRLPHPRSALVLAAAAALSQTGLYLMLQNACSGMAFRVIADALAAHLRESEIGDSLLYSLNMAGLLPLTVQLDSAVTIRNGLWVLSDAARENLISNMLLMVESFLEALVPALLVGCSIYTGALVSAFPLGWAKRLTPALEKAMPVPEPMMDPFQRWFIPRSRGWQAAVLGVAGFFLSRASAPALYTLGNIFFQVFSALFTIQALALINYRQCLKGRRTWWRVLLPFILLWFFAGYIWIVGLADQAMDFRSLRGPRVRPGDDREEE